MASRWVVAAIPLMIYVSACAKAHARTEPSRPPLEVPNAPERVIVSTVEMEAPPDSPPVEGPVLKSTPAPGRPGPRASGTRSEPAGTKTEQPKTDTAGSKADVGPDKPATALEPQLRTPQSPDDVEAERRVREVLNRAARALLRVNSATLGADAAVQYQTARNFIQQCEVALKAGNLVFARFLADKAETLAANLVVR